MNYAIAIQIERELKPALAKIFLSALTAIQLTAKGSVRVAMHCQSIGIDLALILLKQW
jgi:hypothetical protein